MVTESLADRFPREARVRVRTRHHAEGDAGFAARIVGWIEPDYLRVRTDDGLVIAVRAADCSLSNED